MHCTKYLAFSVSEHKNIITPIKPPSLFPSCRYGLELHQVINLIC